MQGRTQIMGILNITPDSFSDGGQLMSVDAAVQHARKLVSQGADLLDIGGQSTRPGADRLTAAQEAERVVPVMRWAPCQLQVSAGRLHFQVHPRVPLHD